jgi:hypothetical protein
MFAEMLRIETSFQDTPGDGYYFVLRYEGHPLEEQLTELGLRDGDTIILWEPDCTHTTRATLLIDFHHPMGPMIKLWAREISD